MKCGLFAQFYFIFRGSGIIKRSITGSMKITILREKFTISGY